nr:MerR family DNA-binding transcriptional regulator [Motiliproteus sp. SC1-56]
MNQPETAEDTQPARNAKETYSITQLSQEFDISPRTIRYYEAKGLLNPDRSRYRRAYSKRDRVRLMLILRGKRVGFSLDETRDLFDIYDSGTGEETQLRHWYRLLTEHEERLLQNKKDIEELLEEIDSAKKQCRENLDKHPACST